MGLDVHNLTLLRLARERGCDFSRVLTIGRQSLQLEDNELIAFLRSIDRPDLGENIGVIKGDGYCEGLLKAVFGATVVESIDASAFENASIVHDMNLPLVVSKQYSAVLDFGCLEHVFNFPVAISNVIRACDLGGRILHALPSNNFCGHGFYQFSPEVFFNIYSNERGFADTTVFLVELGGQARWYKVRSPFEIKKRVNVVNRERTYAFVLTTKIADGHLPTERPPQQSDYAEAWRLASQAGGSDPSGKNA